MPITTSGPVVFYGPWETRTTKKWAVFDRRCPKCRRIIKADETSNAEEAGTRREGQPNATCKHCGRVRMAFLGWDEEQKGE